MAPQVVTHPEARPTDRGSETVDKQQSTAQPANPSTEDHDDTVEAHYASLERPHVCLDGTVFIGHLVVGEDGEEVEVFEAVPCRRCAAVDR
jgi:hypothetical protein